MNPVPRNDSFQTGESFEPFCEEVEGCNAQQWTNETQTKQDMSCRCSGIWGPYNMEIVVRTPLPRSSGPLGSGYRDDDDSLVCRCAQDTVLIPPTIKPGSYVLGCKPSRYRWHLGRIL